MATSGGKGPRHRGPIVGRELSGAGVPGGAPAAPGRVRRRQRPWVGSTKGSQAGDVWKGVKSGCKTLCQRSLGDPNETPGGLASSGCPWRETPSGWLRLEVDPPALGE